MSSQAHHPSNARFALCPPRPLPSVLFIYYVQEESTSVVASSVCMFAHACLPSLIPSLPFLAFNALSPSPPPTPVMGHSSMTFAHGERSHCSKDIYLYLILLGDGWPKVRKLCRHHLGRLVVGGGITGAVLRPVTKDCRANAAHKCEVSRPLIHFLVLQLAPTYLILRVVVAAANSLHVPLSC